MHLRERCKQENLRLREVRGTQNCITHAGDLREARSLKSEVEISSTARKTATQCRWESVRALKSEVRSLKSGYLENFTHFLWLFTPRT